MAMLAAQEGERGVLADEFFHEAGGLVLAAVVGDEDLAGIALATQVVGHLLEDAPAQVLRLVVGGDDQGETRFGSHHGSPSTSSGGDGQAGCQAASFPFRQMT